MQQSMNDLKNTVDIDKTSVLTSAQDSLKAKVKESNVTLVRTKSVSFRFYLKRYFIAFLIHQIIEFGKFEKQIR